MGRAMARAVGRGRRRWDRRSGKRGHCGREPGSAGGRRRALAPDACRATTRQQATAKSNRSSRRPRGGVRRWAACARGLRRGKARAGADVRAQARTVAHNTSGCGDQARARRGEMQGVAWAQARGREARARPRHDNVVRGARCGGAMSAAGDELAEMGTTSTDRRWGKGDSGEGLTAHSGT